MHDQRVDELVPLPLEGRVFDGEQWAGFADTSPSGRVRLDAIARWLQDVAYADVADAGLADSAVWVVRRSRLHVRRFPRFAEPVRLSTFCSGFGRAWAERRTNVWRGDGNGEPDVEAVSLWVHLDPGNWRPAPLSDRERLIYGTAANGRLVSARLRHPPPPPPPDAERRMWRFRATECDIAGHINNAAYWAPLEDRLVALQAHGAPEPERLDVEIEYRTPAQAGDKVLVREGQRWWVVGDDGELHASLLVTGYEAL